jgi:hypothetical protein
MRSLSVLSLLLCLCCPRVVAEQPKSLLQEGERLIGYVQQEKAGELVMVSLIQNKERTGVVVFDVRQKGREKKTFQLLPSEFDAIWSVFTGQTASAFVFVPTASDNMSDVGYLTIKLMSPSADICLKIPNDSCPKELSEVVGKIKSFIGTN